MINALNILLTDNLSTTYFYTALWIDPFVAHFKPGGLVDLKETVTLLNSLILHRIFLKYGTYIIPLLKGSTLYLTICFARRKALF